MPPKRKNTSAAYADATGKKANKRSAQSRPTTRTSRGSPSIKDEADISETSDTSATPDPTGDTQDEPIASGTTDRKNSNGSNVTKEEPDFDHSRPEERAGIVQREFYPAEMSNERCGMYNNNEIPRPIEQLEEAISSTVTARRNIKAEDAVVHWVKRDLRLHDNHALSLAWRKAKEGGVPLICIFLISPQDYQAHLTSPARVDFELRTLEILKKDLAELDIPLWIETVEKRKRVPTRLIELAHKWGANHIYCNIEYEVDELRRETRLIQSCLDEGIAFTPVHDDVVVPPGCLASGQGNQYAVYSPWFKSWVTHVHSNPDLLKEFPSPESNPKITREKYADLFEVAVPSAPSNKSLTPEQKSRFERLWPAGEHAASDRIDHFLKEKVGMYSQNRDYPGANSTAVLSVHHAAGTLASRTSIRRARDMNNTKKLNGGHQGIVKWISEVAWRDFYRHVLAHWPYICMHKPFKYEYTNIQWEYDDDHFQAWCEGRTGYPIVDAAMRQLNATGYMHNRCRMIAASFLSKHLLLDWRRGERYFMEHLIDGDFASNSGGWGFSASVGVDPQPYFRIFNPWLQSEKFDAEGGYIRTWVEELKEIKGNAVHEPYARGAGDKVAKKGYPKPIVEHKFARERALARYKAGIGRDTS